MEQLSLLSILGDCIAIQRKTVYADGTIDLSYYCSECGAFISHPRPNSRVNAACPECHRIIKTIRNHGDPDDELPAEDALRAHIRRYLYDGNL